MLVTFVCIYVDLFIIACCTALLANDPR